MAQDNNPKTPFGNEKLSVQHVPLAPVYLAGLAHYQGALKYGPFNWRFQHVSASTYIEAARRHIGHWAGGEENAKDSGIHHLAHAVASLNILMDAQLHDTLVDDRNRSPLDYDEFFDQHRTTLENIRAKWGKKDEEE